MDHRPDTLLPHVIGHLELDPPRCRPVHVRQARKLRAAGFDLAGVADVLEVDTGTLDRWARDCPELAHALDADATQADASVAAALYRRAVGCDVVETRVLRNGATVQAVRHVPPDVRACAFWLANRQPEQWSGSPARRTDVASTHAVPG